MRPIIRLDPHDLILMRIVQRTQRILKQTDVEHRSPHLEGRSIGRLNYELRSSEAILGVGHIVTRDEEGRVCDRNTDRLFAFFVNPKWGGREKGA